MPFREQPIILPKQEIQHSRKRSICFGPTSRCARCTSLVAWVRAPAGESFGDPYELPSEQAYAETCASIANVMWNFRMLTLTGDARYTDVLERALYNGVNSGMSLSGNLYCYRNPLSSSGEKLRNPWYDTTCCPPNIETALRIATRLFLCSKP